jgi:hypothetical protein
MTMGMVDVALQRCNGRPRGHDQIHLRRHQLGREAGQSIETCPRPSALR